MSRYKRQMFWLSVYFGLNFFLLAFYFLCTHPPPSTQAALPLLIHAICTRADQRFYAPQYKLLGYSICVSRSTVRNTPHTTLFLFLFYFLYFGARSDWSTLGQALVMEWNSFLLLMTVCRNVITWYVCPMTKLLIYVYAATSDLTPFL
jgi:hypothetical protein